MNKAQIIGHLGADPEVRNTGTSQVCNIRVATTEKWNDKNSGQKQERTEWHRVTFFGKLADVAAQYLRKGSQVYIEGRIQTSEYTDKEGIKRYSHDIIAKEMEMLGGKGEHASAGNGAERPAQRPAPAAADAGMSGDIPF